MSERDAAGAWCPLSLHEAVDASGWRTPKGSSSRGGLRWMRADSGTIPWSRATSSKRGSAGSHPFFGDWCGRGRGGPARRPGTGTGSSSQSQSRARARHAPHARFVPGEACRRSATHPRRHGLDGRRRVPRGHRADSGAARGVAAGRRTGVVPARGGGEKDAWTALPGAGGRGVGCILSALGHATGSGLPRRWRGACRRGQRIPDIRR